ncbi:MAG: segregation/condensation protein A [Desulfomonile sp.]|jgi:segregation and condensation protein A|nr:segregation/condensation protein A [Deltaproteobacteria bacterium]
MSYEVQLEVFEGPLDLLLHLIQRNEVSITDIPMSLITQQYLDTIELMQSLNLDVAGEYLVMAAYLVHIKSQMLLPACDEEEIPEPGDDPRSELVEHLLEYKRYKEAAEKLASVNMLDREVFVRPVPEDCQDLSRSAQPLQGDIGELLAAFRTVLQRISRKDLIELQPDRLLVQDKINQILHRLKSRQWLTFWSLFDEDSSRLSVVTTFLALLEIVKLQLARIYQDTPFGTILISRQTQWDGSAQHDLTLYETGSG